MRTEDITPSGARVVLDRTELLILANTLNLALHGLEVEQFSTVIGADAEAAEELWREVGAAFDGVAAAVDPTRGGAD